MGRYAPEWFAGRRAGHTLEEQSNAADAVKRAAAFVALDFMKAKNAYNSPLEAIIESYAQAIDAQDPMAEFCNLITIDPEGYPQSRTVTIRNITNESIVIYANTQSPKIQHLAQCPKYEINLFWPTIMAQYRLRGSYKIEYTEDFGAKWHQKPYAGKLMDIYNAHGRRQSTPIDSYATLVKEVESFSHQYPEDASLKMPDCIRMIVLDPTYIESWVGSVSDRLHHRRNYQLIDGSWQEECIVP